MLRNTWKHPVVSQGFLNRGQASFDPGIVYSYLIIDKALLRAGDGARMANTGACWVQELCFPVWTAV